MEAIFEDNNHYVITAHSGGNEIDKITKGTFDRIRFQSKPFTSVKLYDYANEIIKAYLKENPISYNGSTKDSGSFGGGSTPSMGEVWN